MTVPKAAPVLVTSAIEPIEPESAPALLPAGAVARTRQPDPEARRRANLALLFAAASLAVVVLMFSAQLAVRRISPPGGLARPGLTQGSDVVAAGQGETANLVENPIALPTATAFLLTRSISGGLAVQPSPSGASGATGISSSSGNSHGTGHVVRSHGGGSATRGPNGGGSPGGGSGQPQGRPAGANGGGGGGNSGSPSHGQSGLSHGKSSQSHGHSGLSHGKSSQSHGHSAQSHGHSAQSHGHSGH